VLLTEIYEVKKEKIGDAGNSAVAT
jgi:hypothetical protein